MNYKKIMLEKIQEKFLNDVISEDTCLLLSEIIMESSNYESKQFLNEVNLAGMATKAKQFVGRNKVPIAITGGVAGIVGLRMALKKLSILQRRTDSDWKDCRSNCLSKYQSKMYQAEEAGDMGMVHQLQMGIKACNQMCDKKYYKQMENIKNNQSIIKRKMEQYKEISSSKNQEYKEEYS